MYLQSHIFKNIPVNFDFIITWNQRVFLCSPCIFRYRNLRNWSCQSKELQHIITDIAAGNYIRIKFPCCRVKEGEGRDAVMHSGCDICRELRRAKMESVRHSAVRVPGITVCQPDYSNFEVGKSQIKKSLRRDCTNCASNCKRLSNRLRNTMKEILYRSL
jgi:hypothetical protein